MIEETCEMKNVQSIIFLNIKKIMNLLTLIHSKRVQIIQILKSLLEFLLKKLHKVSFIIFLPLSLHVSITYKTMYNETT